MVLATFWLSRISQALRPTTTGGSTTQFSTAAMPLTSGARSQMVSGIIFVRLGQAPAVSMVSDRFSWPMVPTSMVASFCQTAGRFPQVVLSLLESLPVLRIIPSTPTPSPNGRRWKPQVPCSYQLRATALARTSEMSVVTAIIGRRRSIVCRRRTTIATTRTTSTSLPIS